VSFILFKKLESHLEKSLQKTEKEKLQGKQLLNNCKHLAVTKIYNPCHLTKTKQNKKTKQKQANIKYQ
jgi:hypothetical protein